MRYFTQEAYDRAEPCDYWSGNGHYEMITSEDFDNLKDNFSHLVDMLYGKEPLNLQFIQYHLEEIGAVLNEKIYESPLAIGEKNE
jgi:hypothetical protein